MHRAILAGATPGQVADAAGMSVRGAFERWQRWADGQRQLILAGRRGMTEAEYENVCRRFAAASTGPLAWPGDS